MGHQAPFSQYSVLLYHRRGPFVNIKPRREPDFFRIPGGIFRRRRIFMLRKGFFEIAGISRAIRRTEPRTVRKCIALQRAGKLHPRVSGPGPFF